jgi:hypothetical protein
MSPRWSFTRADGCWASTDFMPHFLDQILVVVFVLGAAFYLCRGFLVKKKAGCESCGCAKSSQPLPAHIAKARRTP